MSEVQVTTENGIATITINRPEALNALNSAVLDGIRAAVEGCDARAIVVTGAGKAFVAGADIAEMKDYGPEEAEAFSRRGQEAFQHLADFPGPVVAAINGFALGGGLELALACDILFASSKAKLGLPEATLGVVPGFGGTQRLPERVGVGMAKKLLFSGEIIGAEEAQRIGLVDVVCEPNELMDAVAAYMATCAKNGPLALQEAKRLVTDGSEMPMSDAIAMEAAAFGGIFDTADQKEGMAAFLEKRKANYTGN